MHPRTLITASLALLPAAGGSTEAGTQKPGERSDGDQEEASGWRRLPTQIPLVVPFPPENILLFCQELDCHSARSASFPSVRKDVAAARARAGIIPFYFLCLLQLSSTSVQAAFRRCAGSFLCTILSEWGLILMKPVMIAPFSPSQRDINRAHTKHSVNQC